ncbi:S8 family serine peptidase [Ramlibacter albus]|uniref:S8 family serine peptidase n=1 Tax=Ramlibacter albus TaxID=2079448 RepID=A0A923M785_9BURK|nr:S8 family serine peptidase [Ramlibacter albus]MBC5765123.1 S8 family serine peptidase [Ramlibacter albus]
MKLFNWMHCLLAGALALGIGTTHAAAPAGAELVEGSYIVTFKPPSEIGHTVILPRQASDAARGFDNVPFGEHGTGQSKVALAAALGIRGHVASIFPTINAAHVLVDAKEAERLRRDPRVQQVDQAKVTHGQALQANPGWALDRLDQPTAPLNGQYAYNADGAGRLIFVLDSGLDLSNARVAAEFGGRAMMFADLTGGDGRDCNGHGTQVASAAAGSTYGIAKGAIVRAVKIMTGCGTASDTPQWVKAIDWLTAYAPRGTVVNLSSGLYARDANKNIVCGAYTDDAVENSIRKAYNAGIIVVVSAMNDGCNAAYYTPTRMAEAFVVGATDSSLLPSGKDARAWFSRYGTTISTFSPGTNVAVMNFDGTPVLRSGTSFAAPYMAGIFAAGCQVLGTYCNTMPNSGSIFNLLKGTGTMNTVVEPNGGPLPGGSPSRFISRGVW